MRIMKNFMKQDHRHLLVKMDGIINLSRAINVCKYVQKILKPDTPMVRVYVIPIMGVLTKIVILDLDVYLINVEE